MTSAGTHAAIVLAAGGSVRLGRPKQLLLRDDETLVHRAVRLAATTRPRRLILVTGAGADDIGPSVADLRIETAFNADWSQGLGSSIRRGAAALGDFDGSVLLLGCDQPGLEFEHLRSLLHGASLHTPACAATLHGDALGIPAVVPAAMLFDEPLQDDRGLGARLTRMPRAQVWRLDAPELMLDIDEEADVTAAVMRGLLDP